MKPTNKNPLPSPKQNIDIVISIADYGFEMSIPRETKVSSLLTIVKNYEKLHDMYAPIGSHFIGLASKDNNPVIDYWLTQKQLDFCRFTKNKLKLKALYSIEKYVDKISISDFQFLKCLGKGVIGEVYLVRNKVTGYLFAMKRLRKQAMHDYKTWQGVIKEKKILSDLPPNNHTVNFHGSFESQNYFNFLLDYYPGGELFFHLSAQEEVKLKQKDIKIYFCEIILAMEYLHKNKILYRDLKPENILVDIQGHLRITDFGMSRFGFEEENNAYSFCGSEQYMAPELMEHKNYNFSADFYSIGAILYQLLTNYPPYYGVQEDEKLEQMKQMDLDLSFVDSPHLKQLLMHLLNPDPEMRLCNFQEIKNNPWLSDIDWKQVQGKKQTLKFAPDIYKTYIGEEFLELQEEVERMNGSEDEDFKPIFQALFNFIKTSSIEVVLGMRPSTASDKPYLREISDSQKNSIKDQMNMKRKTTGFIKEKPKSTKHKQNYSIQLFDKDDSSSNSSHTSSTHNSNASNLPYEPKTTRNADLLKSKETAQTFKKCSSKKMMIINETLGKITKQPSEKKLLTKQPSQGNLLKDKMVKMQQKITLKQPTTPIRLVTSTQNPLPQDDKITSHFVSIRQETNYQIKNKENHFSSRAKLDTMHPTLTRQPSQKRITTRHSENFDSIVREGQKENQKRSNMKSKTKEKSKSKDKLELKSRTKENYPSNGNSVVKAFGGKVKLPSGTYKIKLV